MNESNHDLVNQLTQKIGTVFNSLIQNTKMSYQQLTLQMGQIVVMFEALIVDPLVQQLPMLVEMLLIKE